MFALIEFKFLTLSILLDDFEFDGKRFWNAEDSAIGTTSEDPSLSKHGVYSHDLHTICGCKRHKNKVRLKEKRKKELRASRRQSSPKRGTNKTV